MRRLKPLHLTLLSVMATRTSRNNAVLLSLHLRLVPVRVHQALILIRFALYITFSVLLNLLNALFESLLNGKLIRRQALVLQ